MTLAPGTHVKVRGGKPGVVVEARGIGVWVKHEGDDVLRWYIVESDVKGATQEKWRMKAKKRGAKD